MSSRPQDMITKRQSALTPRCSRTHLPYGSDRRSSLGRTSTREVLWVSDSALKPHETQRDAGIMQGRGDGASAIRTDSSNFPQTIRYRHLRPALRRRTPPRTPSEEANCGTERSKIHSSARSNKRRSRIFEPLRPTQNFFQTGAN